MSPSSNPSPFKEAPFQAENKTPQPQTQTEGDKTPALDGPLELPMTSCQNFEKLNHPSIHRVCQIDPEVHNLCIMCDKPANPVYQCKSCAVAQYCCWECNVDDAQHHGLVCAQWPSFSNPPSKTTARVLVFPAQSITPVFAWAEMKHVEGESSPRLLLRHPELLPFTNLLIPGGVGATTSQTARIGCINECQALAMPRVKPNHQAPAFRESPLGHGLFVLEWLPQPSVNLAMDCINRSIQHTTSLDGLKPGHTWLWTGPIIIFSLDVSQTYTGGNTLTVDHITMRDVRHAVDFFSLNLRNSALPTPSSSPTPPPGQPSTSRFPFPIVSGVKVSETHSPVARTLGITDTLEQVPVSRDLPPSNRFLQGVSVLGERLGLAWVVRIVLCHGEELDWLYKGFYSDPPSSSSWGTGTKPKGDGDGDGDKQDLEPKIGEGSVIPAVINQVYTADKSATTQPAKKLLPRSGDGVIFLSAGGGLLLKEHVQALLAFIKEHKIQPNDRRALKPKHFRHFWSKFKAREGIPADVPSPYDVRPVLCDIMPGDKFAVCTEIFRLLLRRTPKVVMDEKGVCSFKKRSRARV
jgi:hypothetical protein